MGRGVERWLRVTMADPTEEEELPVPGESRDGLSSAAGWAGGQGHLVRPVPFLAVPPPSGLPAVSAACCRPVRGGRGNAADG